MKIQQKIIFISLFHLLASRNFLTTDVFKSLYDNPNLKLILFVPDYKKDYFIKNYQRENVLIEGINESVVHTAAFNFFKWLTFCMIPTFAVKLRLRERLHRNRSLEGLIKYILSRLVTILLSYSKIIHNLIRKADSAFSPNYFLKSYINFYKPDYFIITDVFSDIEPLFIQAAKKRKIFNIGMVRSWDNTTTKGLMRALPDNLIVNNEIIKKEAIYFHDIKTENIFVSGIPQFDLALRFFVVKRDDFFKKINVDINKKLILFAPAGCMLSETDWQLCEILKQGIIEKKLSSNLHCLIRSHPGDPALLEKFIPDDHFTVERPGTTFQKSPKVTELSSEDAQHLMNSLFYSEIIIYVNSTIGIDSLPFNKPQIMIEFDGWENKHYIESVKRYHDEDHMRKYLKTGAVRIVTSTDQLFYWINTYLNNPSIDDNNRKKAIVEQLCYLDGQSGKRVTNFILEQLKKVDEK